MLRLAAGAVLLFACNTSAEPDDGGLPDASDASDATVFVEADPCGSGTDGGCGCGQPVPVYDPNETLAGDLAPFDGSVPDGACPSRTFGILPLDGTSFAGATLFRGCTNTTIFLTSTCGGSGNLGDYLVFDLQGNIIGATEMAGTCASTGAAPDYVPCGADASYPFECEVLCGCDTWKCRPFDDAGAKDASPD